MSFLLIQLQLFDRKIDVVDRLQVNRRPDFKVGFILPTCIKVKKVKGPALCHS